MYGAVGAWGLAPAEIDLKQKVAIADFSFLSRNFALIVLGEYSHYQIKEFSGQVFLGQTESSWGVYFRNI